MVGGGFIYSPALVGGAALAPVLLPHSRQLWMPLIIGALATSNILGQAGSGPWQSWIADLLPPARAGRFWGIRQAILSVSLVLAALCYGGILDAFSSEGLRFRGFQWVFALAAIFGTADIAIHSAIFEPPLLPRRIGMNLFQRVTEPLRDRDFRLLTFGLGFWTCAQAMLGYTMGLPGFFSMAFVKDSLGANYAQASWIFIAGGLGVVIWTPQVGRWIDVKGGRETLLRLMRWGPALMLAWLVVPAGIIRFNGMAPIPAGVLFLCAMSLVVSGVYAGVWVCQVRLTQSHTTRANRTVAMGLHWSIAGLMASLGPLASGWIKDHAASLSLHLGSSMTPFTYFQLLVLIHVIVAWGIAVPIAARISSSECT